ncbi:34443_t:CDS:2 [Gigaspora margarita]|uniref:34443_t:CDS:1 n=1 Tax=Gigaspora margarita TaxID=4874 RepID=A0ABN7UJQ2_GIGMA|nr:34443_t:CDS:2 [Gigaspora margarita]
MPEISENNWPSCCPFIRYDVQNDIIEKRARQMIENVIFGIFLCTGWFFGGSGGLIAAVQNFIEGHYLGGGFSIVSTVLILGHILLHLKLCREVRIFYITRCKEDKRDKREEINDY